MRRQFLPFADWLKAIGLSLIVYGHVAAATTVSWTPPVYPKQLGVSFFVFVTGFTLAREQRDRVRVIYNRYFEVFVFGLAFAVLMSAAGAILWSDLNESNYLPLTFGLNVFVNAFPANPTTWYIGTYLHLLLLWAFVFRSFSTRRGWVIVVCLAEIVIRAILIETQGRYVAYMLASNWVAVFILGVSYGRSELPATRGVSWSSISSLVLLAVLWPLGMRLVGWQLTFPFMTLDSIDARSAAFLVSVAVSFVYISYTLAAYRVTTWLPAWAPVRFVARNTTVVFITHMPVYYALEYALRSSVPTYGLRVTIEFLVCLPGLLLVSEAIHRVVHPSALRERLGARLDRMLGSAPVTEQI